MSFLYFNKIDFYLFYKIDGQTIRKRSDIVTLVIFKNYTFSSKKWQSLPVVKNIKANVLKRYFFTFLRFDNIKINKKRKWGSSKKNKSFVSNRIQILLTEKMTKFEYISSKDLHFKNVQFYWKSFRRKMCTVILEYILNTLKTLPRRSSRA